MKPSAPVTAAPLTIQVFCPGKIVNPLNASGWTHWKRSEWAKNWKQIVNVQWLMSGRPAWDGPATVTFVGFVARLFDDEGFIAACKPIRDEAVKLILGTDDGPTCGHRFDYTQIQGDPRRGILIRVRPVSPEAEGGKNG